MGYNKKKKPSEEMETDPVGELIVGKTNNVIRISDIPTFQNNCICTDPENIKLIKAFEKTARNSLEYKNYFYYLKHNMDFRQCAYLPYIRTGIGEIHIELHHSPFTLFDITKIVVCKHIEEFGFDKIIISIYKTIIDGNSFDILKSIKEKLIYAYIKIYNNKT